jgi:hypothetical protein
MSDDDEHPSPLAAGPQFPEVAIADEKNKLRKRKDKLSLQQQQSVAFWHRVFADPIGRREMWGILQACHAFEERFACGPNGFPQPEATWFHAGEQAIGQRLYRSWARLDRAGVFLMHDEHDPDFVKTESPRTRRQAP